MSIFRVIMLAVVSYYFIGGVIAGLIDESYHIMEYVWYWPVHIINWIVELAVDLKEAMKELTDDGRRLFAK